MDTGRRGRCFNSSDDLPIPLQGRHLIGGRAGTNATVGAAAAMWAALRFDPMLARSDAAAVIHAESAITYDIFTTD